MTQYQHIILDFDGTLFDSHPAVVTSLEKTLLHFEFTAPDKLAMEKLIRRGLSLRSMLSELTSKNHIKIKNMMDYYLNIHPNDAISYGHWYPGALAFLKTLCEHYTVWIVSNRQQITLDVICKHFNIIEPDRIIGSTLTQAIKPQTATFLRLLNDELAKITTQRLVIGDTIVDIEFAKALNCDAAWIKHGYGQWTDIQHLPVQYQWSNFQEAYGDLNL
jgi:phosphoglycolate phosphatase